MKLFEIEFFTSRFKVIRSSIHEWWPIWLGLIVLYFPTFIDLFNGIWSTEEQIHGPIIFVLSIWLIHRKWSHLTKRSKFNNSSYTGWVIFIFSLLIFYIGRTQQIVLFELCSFIFIIAAIILIKKGFSAFKVIWFPLFFMLFMIPLPGTIVIELTMPMKLAVSYMTEQLLYWLNYPIARNGVILQIGQYQLLVADACAGLQTLLTLESLGLFYLNVVRHPSLFRNLSLAIFIIPISFVANVMRVIALTLITFYFGDDAGQGFLHGFAGVTLFLIALALILGVDSVLQSIVKSRHYRFSIR